MRWWKKPPAKTPPPVAAVGCAGAAVGWLGADYGVMDFAPAVLTLKPGETAQ